MILREIFEFMDTTDVELSVSLMTETAVMTAVSRESYLFVRTSSKEDDLRVFLELDGFSFGFNQARN